MAAPLRLKITGIKSTFESLTRNIENTKNDIDNEMAASLELMATTSKILFPDAPSPKLDKEYSSIKASIKSEKIKPFNYELIAGTGNDPMAAYIEFGTGRFFPRYPGKEKEWQDLARQYYVNGKGYLRPSPYLYPSVKSGITSLLNNITQIIKKNERL